MDYANEILLRLEKDKKDIALDDLKMEKAVEQSTEPTHTMSLFAPTAAPSVVVEELTKLDILHLTPMDAMNILFDLQKKQKKKFFNGHFARFFVETLRKAVILR